MARNIVICCDGTANEFAQDVTNVVKLHYTLNHDPAKQVTFYHPGLGTMEPAGALTTFSRQVTKFLGKALGRGLANDIRDAYSFLMENYETDDKVFLFGFSRGAYTARAVCSLLSMYGLIRKGNEPLVPYAVRMMMGIDRAERGNSKQQEAKNQYFDLADKFRETMSRTDCRPWFVGVWDTVSSVGWIENPCDCRTRPTIPTLNTPATRFQSMSIVHFSAEFVAPGTDPSRPHGPKDLKQVWFAGVHCDVGGGYPEAESGLSKIALEWMLEEAEAQHLLVDPVRKKKSWGKQEVEYVPPDPNAKVHESLKGAWNLAEVVIKRHYDWTSGKWGHRMNWWRRRTIPPNSLVHESAYQRGGGYSSRLPKDATPVATTMASAVKDD